MSRCPDWRRLNPADRDAPSTPHAAARWREALRHLDGGCPHCRHEALAADPTLIFRRLPATELDSAQEAEEVAAARLAVAAMRTASRLDGREARNAVSASSSRAALPRALRSMRPSRTLRSLRSAPALHALQPTHAARWVLAASLTAMALVFGAGHGWHPVAGTDPVAGNAAAAGSALQASMADRLAAAATGAAATSGAPGAPGEHSPGRAFVNGNAALAGNPGILPASSRPSIEGLSRPEARVYQIDSPHMSVVMIVDDKLDV